MAFLLIDGYNLIGTAHQDLRQARHNLIAQLSRYTALKGHDITVVFDGWKDGNARESRTRTGNVTVIYTRIAENADAIIRRILDEDKRPWIVVSSDREVYDYAFGRESVSVTSQEFEEKILSCLSSAEGGPPSELTGTNEERDSFPDRPYTGRPNKLSKKAKKRLRALNKL